MMIAAVVIMLCMSVVVGTYDTEGWHLQRPKGEQTIALAFAVRQQNRAALLMHFEAVSDPQGSSYGRYMSFQEVNNLLAPKAEHVAIVEELLEGLPLHRTINSDFCLGNNQCNSCGASASDQVRQVLPRVCGVLSEEQPVGASPFPGCRR